jgi:hypothetical protein
VSNKISNSVIGAVASVISNYYYSHSKLNSLFMESGAPDEAPAGNCEDKCAIWLQRCNEDPTIDGLAVLGKVIQKFMDQEPNGFRPEIADGQKRIRESLCKRATLFAPFCATFCTAATKYWCKKTCKLHFIGKSHNKSRSSGFYCIC